MATEASESFKGLLTGIFPYLSDNDPLKTQLLGIIDGISSRSTTARNIAAFARSIRDALPTVKIRNEALRPVLIQYHTQVVELISELENEASTS